MDRAAKHWVKLIQWQKYFFNTLGNYIFYKYEELCESPNTVKDKFIKMIPELEDLTFDDVKSHSIDGKTKGLQNLNQKQIECLSLKDFKEINSVLDEYTDLMDNLGYKKIKPSI